MNKGIKFADIFDFERKSKITASKGKDSGAFPFYTSRSRQSKFVDKKDYEGEALIIGLTGSSNIHYEDKGFSTSSNCIVAKLKLNTRYKIKFIYYYLLGNKHLLAHGFKGQGRRSLPLTHIQNIDIPLFALERQNELIDLFDNIYQAIALRQKSIDLLDRYLTNSFLKVNNAQHSTKSIREIAKQIRSGPSGKTIKKDMYLKDNFEKGYRIYTHGDLTDELDQENDFSINYVNKILNEHNKLRNYLVQEDDVLVTRLGYMGKALVIPKLFQEGIVNTNLFKVSIDKDTMLPEYFHSLYKSPYMIAKLNKLTQGTIMPTLSKEKLELIRVPVPPIEVQEEFVQLKILVLEQKNLFKKSLLILEKYLISVAHLTFNPDLIEPEDNVSILMDDKVKMREIINSVRKLEENENTEITEFQYLENVDKLFKILDRTSEEEKTAIKSRKNDVYDRGISQRIDDNRIFLEVNEDINRNNREILHKYLNDQYSLFD